MTTTITHLHSAPAAKRAGIAEAVRLAARHYHASAADTARLARRAAHQYQNGQASPAAAIADAIGTMRRRNRQGGAA